MPIYADKSLEEYNYLLLAPGSYHGRYFIIRETRMQAPMQMLGLLSLKPGCDANLGSRDFLFPLLEIL